MKKEKTRLMITRLMITDLVQTKKLVLGGLCLIGNGSITYQSAMKEFNKEWVIKKKRTTGSSNIFQAAIVDLKLGAAGKHFETLILFLADLSISLEVVAMMKNF